MTATLQKVNFTKVRETLLLTLYGKAEESFLPNSLLQDRFAAKVVRRLDYDFSKLKVRRDMMISLAVRAHVLDDWVREFIAKQSEATVLHLGCGLDSRVFRVNPPPRVRWFDVDFPDVVELRSRLYPKRENYQLIGVSVTDPGWLEKLPADQPVIVIAEGILPYLREREVLRLLERITTHFPHGEVAFDGYSPICLRLVRRHHVLRATGATMHWGLRDPRDLEKRFPKLKLMNEMSLYDPAQMRRGTWSARIVSRLAQMIPALARSGRLVRYRF